MTKRTLRNVCYVVLAALSAALEGPRLAHEPLTVASAELTSAPSAISRAAAHVVSNVSSNDDASADDESHLGFDTNVYPGDRAMAAWKRFGEYEWVGYYLQAQCHKDDSWSGTRQRLTDAGWGLAVIYVGQQTWGKSYGPVKVKKRVLVRKNGRRHYVTRTMTRRSSVPVATTADGCSSSFVNAAQGAIDGRDAVRKAAHEGFPNGTVLFLDIEHMESVPQRMRDYYRAWTRTVLADGRYRPGIYSHTRNAGTIFNDVSAEYDRAGVNGDPPFWIAGSSGFSIASVPTEVGHAFATAWQGALDVVRSHNGVQLPIDISVASVASPSDVQTRDVR